MDGRDTSYFSHFVIPTDERTRAKLKAISEFAKAQKEGRCIILPCSMQHDEVYIIEDCYRRGKCVGAQIATGIIDHITIGSDQIPLYTICTETGNWYEALKREDFCLTLDEAEAALEEENHER